MTMHLLFLIIPILLGACGEDSKVGISNVLGIQSGNKEGTALSGSYTTIFEIKSDGCSSASALQVPVKGTQNVLNVEVEQNGGSIKFTEIESTLRGGINFENRFEAGAADIVDRGGEGNILRTIVLKGSFEDANSYEGKGEERLQGRIGSEEVDCTFSFEVSGIRK